MATVFKSSSHFTTLFPGLGGDPGTFDDEFSRFMESREYERDRPETPGLVTQTTDTQSSSGSRSPTLTPAAAAGGAVLGLDLIETKKLDDSLTYPQLPDENPPRSPILSLIGTHGSSGSGNRSGTGSPTPIAGPKRRVDREAAALVRGNGACLRCKSEKIKCSVDGACARCTTLSQSHPYPCIRTTLPGLGRSYSDVCDSWPINEDLEAIVPAPRRFTGKKVQIQVCFSEVAAIPQWLQLTAEQYEDQSQAPGRRASYPCFAFSNRCVPSHDDLVNWVTNQVRCESNSSFQNAIEYFLVSYCDDRLPKADLVKKVHKFSCMYRIWSQPIFYCRTTAGQSTELPLPIQADLRNIARRAMRSLETDILKDLDACLFNQKKSIQREDRPALWAILWRLILVYRDLLGRKLPVLTIAPERRAKCGAQTFEVFKALVVSYAGLVRFNKKNLEQAAALETEKLPPLFNLFALQRSLEAATAARNSFYLSIQPRNETDKLLKGLIADPELKKLGLAPRTTRLQQRRQNNGALSDVGEPMEIDDDGDNDEAMS